MQAVEAVTKLRAPETGTSVSQNIRAPENTAAVARNILHSSFLPPDLAQKPGAGEDAASRILQRLQLAMSTLVAVSRELHAGMIDRT